jgi:predicted TIM-barrel fold metal-dependent hydrolase
LHNSNRRSFLKNTAALASLSQEAAARSAASAPYSAGTERPRLQAPAHAVDCHHHIYDPRFPLNLKAASLPGYATVADYRLLQKRIGTTRNVVVSPSPYRVDNRCLLDALHQFGPSARGIAVVNADVADAELKELDAAGVRGIRFTLARNGPTSVEMVEPLSKRIAALGWHIQVNTTPEQILAAMPIWNRLPVPVVFDHLGHAPAVDSELFKQIAKMLQQNKAWVKLSGAYLDTKVGPPGYADASAIAKAYVKEAPERLVWGSDWPHPSVQQKPDDALLFDLLADWIPDSALRTRILVENPARLYNFS